MPTVSSVTLSSLSRHGWRRPIARLAADPHVLLAVAVVLAALVIEVAADIDPVQVVLPATMYLTIQIVVGLLRYGDHSPSLETARLLFGVVTIFWMNLRTGEPSSMPLIALYLPIIAMSASIGWRPIIVVGGAALTGALISVASAAVVTPGMGQRAIALLAVTVVLVIGTRRTIAALERAVAHARAASSGQRRRARQMAAIEAVGRLLASTGPTQDALDEVMDLLVARFGYRYVSIYTLDDRAGATLRLRLGAQRGYTEVIETFDGSIGVVGRVMRTGEPSLVRDVTTDPDYRAANPDVRSEVCVPLRAGDALLGVLNVESDETSPLDEGDRETMMLIGDRVAAALALAREREALRQRADLFARLASFGLAINASLDPATANASIIAAVAEVLQTDLAVLVLRDVASGEDRIAAMVNGDQRYVGATIPAGEGTSGEAIATKRIVVRPEQPRSDFPSTVRGVATPDTLTTAAFPILRDHAVVGAVTISRYDLSKPFSPLEIEALPLLASQISLALANVDLHAQMADAAVRDPLTGLWNRRHLDAASARLFAARDRLAPEARHPVAAILFDLDHFGAFNKQHGHATGDAVLRAFGSILARRVRSSDLVARFGGEEFVVVLDGASLNEAQRVAEEIRRELEAVRVQGAEGESLRATVSAGCASLRPDVTSLQALLEVADVGLQMAKRGGRNQVVAA